MTGQARADRRVAVEGYIFSHGAGHFRLLGRRAGLLPFHRPFKPLCFLLADIALMEGHGPVMARFHIDAPALGLGKFHILP